MYSKKIAIIVAGGTGQRMGSVVPKQFLEIEGKSILLHTIDQFVNAFDDISLVVVLPEGYIEEGKKLLNNRTKNPIQFIAGGETRFESVKNGLTAVKEKCIVFVHDAVRCLLTPALIQRCYQQAVENGSAIPAVSSTDTVRIMENETHHLFDREKVMLIQTPQTFQSEVILAAFNQVYQPNFTDEANVVEASGQPVFLVDGEFENIKITRPLDLAIATYVLTKRLG
ncbi:MAG: 2-C-methyl-D-erythritol 4-phosphate cytidylyltransferase [Chitinophagaceae bacterium]|nr:2-C-methyl-D-erythritol 4-phosphate cytidylyltransferase [Chitinophagaceae bacterium]